MEGPSDFYQLIQAYVIIAVGVLAIIVMFDSKSRRNQETRLALILGQSGNTPVFDLEYLKKEAEKLSDDVSGAYAQGKSVAKGLAEGLVANRVYGRQMRCDPATDVNFCMSSPTSFVEGTESREAEARRRAYDGHVLTAEEKALRVQDFLQDKRAKFSQSHQGAPKYGAFSDTACMSSPVSGRVDCNLASGNNMNYYEGYTRNSYLSIGDEASMNN